MEKILVPMTRHDVFKIARRVFWAAICGCAWALAVWAYQGIKAREAAFKASITAEKRVQMDTFRLQLTTFPVYTLVTVESRSFPGYDETIILGAFLENSKAATRFVTRCAEGGEGPQYDAFGDDKFLIRVKKLTRPQDPGYAETSVRCVREAWILRAGGKPVEGAPFEKYVR
jgi:hypothetical protein